VATERALLVAFGGLGNGILLSPLFRALATRHTVDLLVADPLVAEYYAAAPARGDLLLWRDCGWAGLLRRRGHWTLAVAGAAMQPLRAGLLLLAAGAPQRIAEHGFACTARVSVAEPEEHELQRNLRLAAAAGCPGMPEPALWSLTLDGVPALPTRFVALHAGSGGRLAGKRWPLDRFAALTRMLIAGRIPVVALGGPDETGLGHTLAAAGAVDLCGRLSLAQTAGVLRAASLYVGNDSGLMHLAAAAGTRCCALFGPTREAKNAPWGNGHRVLTAPVGCRPCYANRPITCPHGYACLSGISVEQVHAAVRDLLA